MGNLYKFVLTLYPEMGCKMLFDSERSQSHVEMIVSFVLFMGFVVFLLLVFNPQKYESINYNSVDNIQTTLMKNLTFEYNYTSVILVSTISVFLAEQCFQIASIEGISNDFIVKDMNGAVVYSRNESSGQIVIKANNSQRFYGIYSSPDFSSGVSAGCQGNLVPLTKSRNYSLGMLTTKNAVLYERIKELNHSYYVGYEELKESLGMKNDFSFTVKDETGYILFDTTLKQPENINILSREIPFLSINKQGETENLFMNLRVW